MVFAAEIGATALYLTYAWLASAAFAGYLSGRKGYGERPGLAAGMLLNVVGVLIWLAWPPREDSLWKKVGPFGRPKSGDIEGRAAAAAPPEREGQTGGPHATGAADTAAVPASGDVAPKSSDTTERP